ncbi:MFS transporter [Clostridium sp. 'deep sea']|uniref:MFS transporter n=1 Tax=Clostridium sp. 'deep sea' TaxID=2779445 RepID=UPI0018969881|nr:MFS transporter [Clostridium sp. 'deep sea']QOR35306.1 MFS transporter [Clostridium sp. 'deep sea']
MNYLNNIQKLGIRVFFHNLIFAYVIERLFWQQRGMTVLMVVYTEIIYAVTIIFLEIPTGILADKFSRKKMIVFASFLTLCEFIIIIYANNFWHFALVVFIAGISTSMVSGSETALLYDTLKKANQENKFETVLGQIKAADFSAALIAALAGGFLANKFNYEFNYYLSIVSVMISFMASLTLVDVKVTSNNDKPIPLKQYITSSLQVFKNNPNITIIVVSGMFLVATLTYLDEFWQVYLNNLNIPIYSFGIFGALFLMGRIPGSLAVAKLLKKYSYKQLLSFNLLLSIVGFILMAVIKTPLSLIALILVFLGSGLTEPLVTGYLHHRIDSKMRATIDSFLSLGLRIATIIIGLVFGYIASKFSIFSGFAILGFLCLCYYIYFVISTNKIKM